MKKSANTTEKLAPKAEQANKTATTKTSPKKPAKPVATKTKPKKPTKPAATKAKPKKPAKTATSKATPKKTSPTQKTVTKAQAVLPKPAVATIEKTIPERVGLTAGSIWHYLSENGATPVAKLLRELSEEEKIIQRSIGWLAQEGKINLDT
ncbi:MAG: hypothetical protein GQ529_00495, partial [Methyloprofundus sp.]|nr:hypothetical protein [Methyloprofundus sp.]